MKFVARMAVQLVPSIARGVKIPFCESIEGFVGSFSNDSDLIAANSIDEPAAFNHCFRANENKVDLVHCIGDRRVQDDCTWNASSCEGFCRLNSGMIGD